MPGVFADLRVLDLSWGVAGPMTTMFMADNGADVVRIEAPSGDPFARQTGYRVWNRGKRSIRLDLQSDDGRNEFEMLARTSDIVVDSFSLGTTERLGVDHATLSALNSRVITCSISAYGEHTSHRDRPGYDGLVAARTGLLYDQKGRRGTAMEFICGRPGPLPEFEAPEGLVRGADRDGPVFPRTPWPSVGAAYFATLGIAAALRARQVSGRGQRVTTSLLQGALAAVCLNWQRVEDPDARCTGCGRSTRGRSRVSTSAPMASGFITGRFAALGSRGSRGERALPGRDGLFVSRRSYRVSMEPDGMLTGSSSTNSWQRRSRSSRPTSGCVRLRMPDWASPPSDRPARPWPTSPSSQTAASWRSTIRRRARFDTPALAGVLPTPGSVAGHAPRPGEHTEEVLREADSRSLSGGGHAANHSTILFLGSVSSISASGWPDRSPDVSWRISEPTSSRSTCCTTRIGMARTWASGRIAEAKHRSEPQGPGRQGGPGEASRDIRRDDPELETRRCRAPRSRL